MNEWQTVLNLIRCILQHLIWVYTVCSGLSVPILRLLWYFDSLWSSVNFLFFWNFSSILIHYENTPIQIYWKFYHQKLYIKNSDILHISAQNIDCGYSLEPPQRGSSNEYPQSMFLSRNKKNNVFSCKPQFYNIKVGFKGVKIVQACFCDEFTNRVANSGYLDQTAVEQSYLGMHCLPLPFYKKSWRMKYLDSCHTFHIMTAIREQTVYTLFTQSILFANIWHMKAMGLWSGGVVVGGGGAGRAGGADTCSEMDNKFW